MIGLPRACDLMLTGRIFTGKEAAEMGLANEALPKEKVLPRALEIARYIAMNVAPISVAMSKKMIWEHLACPTPERAADRESVALWELGRGSDAREGVAAFLEKRNPHWTLRPSADMPVIPELR